MKDESIVSVAQRAVMGAPSRRALTESIDKMRTLGVQREEAKAEAKRLQADIGEDVLAKQAEAVRAGREVPQNNSVEAARSAYRKVQILDTAIEQERLQSVALRAKLSAEVNAAIKTARHATVEKTKAALATLRAIAVEEERLVAELNRGGVDVAAIDRLTFLPVSTDVRWDDVWLAGARAANFAA